MKKILVASHGCLADGIKSSVGILTGNQDLITTVNAYVDESDCTATIQEFIDSVKPDDDAVIFTDIYGGSVFQKVMLLEPEKKGIVHVTGFNLAAVIETLIRTDPITPELMDQIVQDASGLMQRMECVSDSMAATDGEGCDDDFFE